MGASEAQPPGLPYYEKLDLWKLRVPMGQFMRVSHFVNFTANRWRKKHSCLWHQNTILAIPEGGLFQSDKHVLKAN